jgi:hypothetical protein
VALTASVVWTVPAKAAVTVFGGMFWFSQATTDFTLIHDTGFQFVPGSSSQVAQFAAYGLKTMVWLGSYSNTTCSFAMSDAEVTTRVSGLVGNPSVYAYQLGDEPDPHLCPGSPAQYTARTALVHSIDPAAKTFVVDASYNPPTYPEFPAALSYYKGTVDILGFDIYPCLNDGLPCHFDWISAAQPAIAQNGPYLAVLQDFQDATYRRPTSAELSSQCAQWLPCQMSPRPDYPDALGIMVFAYDWQGSVTPNMGTWFSILHGG